MIRTLELVRNASGWTSGTTAVVTTAAAVEQHSNPSSLQWFGDNALAIGAICSICTCVIFGVTAGLRSYLDLKDRKERKKDGSND